MKTWGITSTNSVKKKEETRGDREKERDNGREGRKEMKRD